jgi:malic enzyme
LLKNFKITSQKIMLGSYVVYKFFAGNDLVPASLDKKGREKNPSFIKQKAASSSLFVVQRTRHWP